MPLLRYRDLACKGKCYRKDQVKMRCQAVDGIHQCSLNFDHVNPEYREYNAYHVACVDPRPVQPSRLTHSVHSWKALPGEGRAKAPKKRGTRGIRVF